MKNLKVVYKTLRAKEVELENLKATLVASQQMGRVINNFAAKINIIDLSIEKVNIEANLVRLELVDRSKVDREASIADKKADALLARVEARRKASVQTPFACLPALIQK